LPVFRMDFENNSNMWNNIDKENSIVDNGYIRVSLSILNHQ